MSRAWLAVIGLLVALALMWVLRSLVVTPTAPPAPVAQTVTAAPTARESDAAAVDVVAAGSVAGVPVGYPASAAGAATAAVNWIASLPTLLDMGPLRLTDTLNRLWSTRAAGEIEGTMADYFALADRADGDLSSWLWIEAPLRTNLTVTSTASATVEVWAVLVFGDRVAGPIEMMWRTHRLDLVWERDDWRIALASVVEGPTPVGVTAALPSPASGFAAVEGWQPAVFVDTVPSTLGVR